jgi:hypothetical protein
MSTRTLSAASLSILNQYLHFQAGTAVCSMPYFNNKSKGLRGALRTSIGKGSPKEISDEVSTLLIKNRISSDSFSDEALKKLLVDHGIGIDCSGFAYHVLDAESRDKKKGGLEKHFSFVQSPGFLGKIRGHLRPIENTGVATFAHDENSRAISVSEVSPGDVITMVPAPKDDSSFQHLKTISTTGAERDHILVIHQVEYDGAIPHTLYYSHSLAYPEDGVYGTGIKQGTIEITDPSQPITSQRWVENGREGMQNPLLARAVKSKTELRRLKWF